MKALNSSTSRASGAIVVPAAPAKTLQTVPQLLEELGVAKSHSRPHKSVLQYHH
jgi:hypothetical protein